MLSYFLPVCFLNNFLPKIIYYYHTPISQLLRTKVTLTTPYGVITTAESQSELKIFFSDFILLLSHSFFFTFSAVLKRLKKIYLQVPKIFLTSLPQCPSIRIYTRFIVWNKVSVPVINMIYSHIIPDLTAIPEGDG